jgi:acyl-CoA reductase-like NAD-dependent aldehyde dehydrogenase
MARLLELTRGLRVGHPFSDGTHVGPLINDKHRQSVQEYVELAKREGRVLCGGRSRPIRRWRRQLLPADDHRRAEQQARVSGRDLRPGTGGDAVSR